MAYKLAELKNLGMDQDTSISKEIENTVFENQNIRITAQNDTTQLSITNEKGPRQCSLGIYTRNKKFNYISFPNEGDGNLYPKAKYPVTSRIVINLKVDEGDPEPTEYSAIIEVGDTEGVIYRSGNLFILNWNNNPTIIEAKFDIDDTLLSAYEDESYNYRIVNLIYGTVIKYGNSKRGKISTSFINNTNISVSVNYTYSYTTQSGGGTEEATIIIPQNSNYKLFTPQSGQLKLVKSINSISFISGSMPPTADYIYVIYGTDIEATETWVYCSNNINGVFIGYTILNNYLVLFTHQDGVPNPTDYIYRIQKSSTQNIDYDCFILHSGNLGFSTSHPIEALPYYETETIQKVYWVDGYNKPRYINISPSSITYNRIQGDNQFDFFPSVNSFPTIEVTKEYNNIGSFKPGVIQYFVSYYNQHGAETKILAASDLQYIDFKSRGGKADEDLSCSFNIVLSNLDKSFDYIRVYSAKRTSLDGPITLSIVGNYSTEDSFVKLYDAGVNQESVDPSLIYYIGGSDFIAGTLTQKDNTAFFGDIKLSEPSISTELRNLIKTWIVPNVETGVQEASKISFTTKNIDGGEIGDFYSYNRQLTKSASTFKTYKRGEIYRFAIQLQSKTGQWISPLWIGDKECTIAPYTDNSTNIHTVAEISFEKSALDNQIFNDYVNYRILIAELDSSSKKIVAQGLVCPTIFNHSSRCKNQTYAVPSYIMRSNNDTQHFNCVTGGEIQGPTDSKYQNPYKDNQMEATPEGYQKKLILAIYKTAESHRSSIMGWPSGGTIHEAHAVLYIALYNTSQSRFESATSTAAVGAWEWGNKNYPEMCTNVENYLHVNLDSLISSKGYIEMLDRGVSVYSQNWNYINSTPSPSNYAHLAFDYQGDGIYTNTVFENGAQVKTTKNDNYITGIYTELSEDVYTKASSTAISMENKFFNYYIDSSIVTLNSPEIDNNLIENNSNYKFRITGYAPTTANRSSCQLVVGEYGMSPLRGLDNSIIESYNKTHLSNISVLLKDNMFKEYGWSKLDNIYQIDSRISGLYPLYMWQREGSVSGYTTTETMQISAGDNPSYFTGVPNNLESKLFAGYRVSLGTTYLEDNYLIPSSEVSIINDDAVLQRLKNGLGSVNYGNSVDTLVYYNDTHYYTIPNCLDIHYKDSVRVKYKNTKHAVLSLTNNAYNYILPRLNYSEEAFRKDISSVTYSITISSTTYTGTSGAPENSDRKEYNYKTVVIYNTSDQKTVYFNSFEIGEEVTYIDEGGVAHDVGTIASINRYELPWERNTDPNSRIRLMGIFNNNSTITEIKGLLNQIWIYGCLNLGYESLEDTINGYNAASKIPLVILTSDATTGLPTTVSALYSLSCSYSGGNVTINFTPITIPDATIIEYPFLSNKSNAIHYKDTITNSKFILLHSETDDSINWDTSISYSQGVISDSNTSYYSKYPYIYIGELYKDIPYNQLYGGYSETALSRLKWIPVSSTTKLTEDIGLTEGDTYYQRYDCLKTYPYGEDSKNNVVDITSVMIETHINLDGRSDINRGTTTPELVRPTNFNLFNDVYNQNNNIFSYTYLGKSFDNNEFSNQVIWSNTKYENEETDSWTNIAIVSSLLNLDGRYGPITKLLNINDTIVAFQEKAISSIQYNDRVQISTEAGIPIEVQNSNKVNGYTYTTTNNGSDNLRSIISTEAGVYFIDTNNRALFRFSKNGIDNISLKGMATWFKNHIEKDSNDPFRLYYDAITKDLYVINNTYCVVFNELLDKFTSFMPYSKVDALLNLDSESYVLYKPDNSNLSLFEMFGGDYNKSLDNNYLGYSITYRVNPEPMLDKTFLNAEYIADCIDPTNSVEDKPTGSSDILTNDSPFDTLEAWNEYQKGSVSLTESYTPADLKRKFRIRRVDLPRDQYSTYSRDRLRNPWIKIKLSKTPNSSYKMELHNFVVKYFK